MPVGQEDPRHLVAVLLKEFHVWNHDVDPEQGAVRVLQPCIKHEDLVLNLHCEHILALFAHAA